MLHPLETNKHPCKVSPLQQTSISTFSADKTDTQYTFANGVHMYLYVLEHLIQINKYLLGQVRIKSMRVNILFIKHMG